MHIIAAARGKAPISMIPKWPVSEYRAGTSLAEGPAIGGFQYRVQKIRIVVANVVDDSMNDLSGIVYTEH